MPEKRMFIQRKYFPSPLPPFYVTTTMPQNHELFSTPDVLLTIIKRDYTRTLRSTPKSLNLQWLVAAARAHTLATFRGFALSGIYTFGVLHFRGIALSGFYTFGVLHFRDFALSGFCTFGKLHFRGSTLSGNCTFGVFNIYRNCFFWWSVLIGLLVFIENALYSRCVCT